MTDRCQLIRPDQLSCALRFWLLVVALYSFALAQAFAGSSERGQLEAQQLLKRGGVSDPVAMAAFLPSSEAEAAQHHIEGRLQLLPTMSAGFRAHRDDYGYALQSAARVQELPAFDFAFIQAGDQLLPTQRGPIPSEHPHWEWVLEPGRVWQEAGDEGYSRAALPFSLQQRGENCIHNGVLSFLYKSDGSVSSVAYQIGSETCLYFQFDLWGQAPAVYTPATVPGAASIARAHGQQLTARLPVRPIEALASDYPGTDLSSFNGEPQIDPAAMTVYGLVINGVHYMGGCQTRYGRYPFCEVLDVPSYSLAKSLVAGLGLMRMQQLYPGVVDARISDYVPECAASGRWGDTTFGNAADMATGLYDSPVHEADEAATGKREAFFDAYSHAGKIAFACKHYYRQSQPGALWVYHTSDTYVLGTALNSYLARHAVGGTDLIDDVLLPWWQALELSPTSRVSRRTYDSVAQPFTGYGLTLHADDIARLASFINGEEISSQLDESMLDAALQRDPEHRGLPAVDASLYYKTGFWGYPGFSAKGCDEPVVLPFMVGYGGINVVLMPNQTIYYYFSDGGTFSWLKAAAESSRIKSFCPPRQDTAHDR